MNSIFSLPDHRSSVKVLRPFVADRIHACLIHLVATGNDKIEVNRKPACMYVHAGNLMELPNTLLLDVIYPCSL